MKCLICHWLTYLCVMESNNKKTRTVAKNSVALMSEFGKIPPQDIDLERVVLGAMMLERNAVNEVIDILNENSFYDPKHQYIYRAIRGLFATTNPIDLVTVTQYLIKNGELEASGGAAYVASLTARVASAANIQMHARLVSEKFIKRELIRVSSEIIRDAYDETVDVFELLNGAEKNLFAIAENNMSKQVTNMQTAVREAVNEIEKAAKNADGVPGVPTGFRKLDAITAGWQRSDMIVLAARPGMGKTAFVLSMARNTAVDYKMGVAVFSLEMSAVQLVKRLIASEARLDAEKLRTGKLADHEFQQLYSKITRLSEAPIYIDDTPGISILDFRAKCRRLKHERNIELIIIDYLQLMSAKDGKGGTREQEISTISRSIKEIAKELNVPIIALSQLSRSVESRGGDKKPQLSDLRESGAIEQDADIVSFIYRPEYYGIDNLDGEDVTGVGEIIIAKHRNGSLGSVRLKFVKQFALFENLDSFGGFYEPTSANNAMNIQSLGAAPTMTVPSKMNTGIEQDFDFRNNDTDSDTPF